MHDLEKKGYILCCQQDSEYKVELHGKKQCSLRLKGKIVECLYLNERIVDNAIVSGCIKPSEIEEKAIWGA